MATGKEGPVIKITQTLGYVPQEIDLDSPFWKNRNIISPQMALVLLQDAATWSLTSNAKQHQKVHDIINNEIDTATDMDLREKLVKILEESEKPDTAENLKQ